MSDTPRWLRASAAVAVAALLLALGKPAVAPLVLRGLLVCVVVATAARVAATRAATLEPLHAYGRRADPRPPNELPRRISTVADELRLGRRDDPAPADVQRALRSALQHRLWHHHGLSSAAEAHELAIRRRISPTAAELLWSGGADRASAGAGRSIPANAIADLIDEVERL